MSLRIAVVGGGPAGSFFALYALKYARQANRDLSVTIYESRDFRRFGRPGCNMCAGIIPASVLERFGEIELTLPAELILSRINTYSLHTSAGTIDATQPDAGAEIISVYRGAGPRYGHPPGLVFFDELLLTAAVARGAELRRRLVEVVRRGPPVEVVDAHGSAAYDLVVLAAGLNGRLPTLVGYDYRPPPTATMCQTELFLGQEEVERRLGSSVHVFLPPDDVAAYGILIPKGPFVTVSLLNAGSQMQSLRRFLDLEQVQAVLGPRGRAVCGCLPNISVGLARDFVDTGFVAIGDASATRLYKNGIGSALTTAERAAWTAVYRGCRREDFRAAYVPTCRTIHRDNRIGRLLFLQVPILKHVGVLPYAHRRLATTARQRWGLSELHMRILWGMFTGAYTYRDLFRMGLSPALVVQFGLAIWASLVAGRRPSRVLPESAG